MTVDWIQWATRPPENHESRLSVPIENFFYLLVYALKQPEARSLLGVDSVAGETPAELFGRLLVVGLRRLAKRGFPRGYRQRRQALASLQGRVLLEESIQQATMVQRRAVCEIDELTRDIAVNQVLKSAARRLLGLPGVTQPTRAGLRSLVVALSDVADVPYGPTQVAAIPRRLDPFTRLMVDVAILAHGGLPKQGDARGMIEFDAESRQLGGIFEDFLREWFRRHAPVFEVGTGSIRADALGDLELLPEMRGDVFLRHADGVVLVEAKCYAAPLQSFWGSRKLRSGHLYQLQAYLAHLERSDPRPHLGLLLYAQVDDVLDERLRLAGKDIWVRSLDLDQPWARIDGDLRRIAAECSRAVEMGSWASGREPASAVRAVGP